MSHKELDAEGQPRDLSGCLFTLAYRRRLFLETVETINKKAVGMDTPLYAVEFRRLVGVEVSLCPYKYQKCQLFMGASCPVKALGPLWPLEVARSVTAGCYFRGPGETPFAYKKAGYGLGAPRPPLEEIEEAVPVGAFAPRRKR